jgi:hypothetical protein
MVTHSSTSRPVQCLCMAERTGCPVFTDLWSYVFISKLMSVIYLFAMEIDALGRSCVPFKPLRPSMTREARNSRIQVNGKSNGQKENGRIVV